MRMMRSLWLFIYEPGWGEIAPTQKVSMAPIEFKGLAFDDSMIDTYTLLCMSTAVVTGRDVSVATDHLS